MKKTKIIQLIIVSIAVILGSLSLINIFFFKNVTESEILYNELTDEEVSNYLKENKVESATKSGDKIYLLIDSEYFYIEDYQKNTENALILKGLFTNLTIKEESGPSFFNLISSLIFIFIILFMIGIIIIIVSIVRGAFDANSSVMPHFEGLGKKDEDMLKAVKPDVTFDDISGCEELKASVMNDVNALKNPHLLKEIGARIPRGIVLYGPPGTGKTLIARAIAGTAGINFISVSASDFVEMYVGVGAKRIRDLYKKARESAPCIVFIDEMDAIGGKRGTSDTERDQTINALLNELNGFSGTEGVLTICATNRLEMLDKALIRPGRFDKQLAVPLPDKQDRFEILKKHSENKKFSTAIDLMDLANKTIGFSGAYLEGLLNEAALIAISEEKTQIDSDCINKAYYRMIMKGDKKKSNRSEEENMLIAWHEAGHTIATKLLTHDSVSSVSIIGSTSGAGGVTFKNPKERILYNKKEIRNLIKVLYAGRAAEHILLNNDDEITTGASNDIKEATYLIKDYLEIYGMGNSGMLYLEAFNKDKPDSIEEAKELSKLLYQETIDFLEENKELLDVIANELIKNETIEEKDIDSLIENFKK